MPTPNPDTHCPECGEVLSQYGHCWQHHWPPMDPAQDAPDDFVRASGDAICGNCEQPYKRHRFDYSELCDGVPYLNVLCDGTKVKL